MRPTVPNRAAKRSPYSDRLPVYRTGTPVGRCQRVKAAAERLELDQGGAGQWPQGLTQFANDDDRVTSSQYGLHECQDQP